MSMPLTTHDDIENSGIMQKPTAASNKCRCYYYYYHYTPQQLSVQVNGQYQPCYARHFSMSFVGTRHGQLQITAPSQQSWCHVAKI
eukprot:4616-Heterococcus_DN1.PRE.3